MNYKLGFLLVAFFSSISADKKRDETCKTPDGKDGKCFPLNKCPVVYDGASSRNPTVLNYTQRSYCGYDEDTLVCCEHPGPVKSVDLLGVLPDITICGRVQAGYRVLSGELTHLGEFPWMVGIYYKNRKSGESYNNSLCGGSLINEEFVLTAAQCLVNREYEIDSVRLGEWDTTQDPDCVETLVDKFCADPVRVVQVEEVIIHPLYSKRRRLNDIGLIRLKDKVTFTDFIAPICLPHPKLPSLALHTRLTIAGWGKTESGTTSDILLRVELPLVSREKCRNRLSHMRTPITLQQLCAGGESSRDSCQEDAGVPLVMQVYGNSQKKQPLWYQYGISSSIVGCGILGYPGIYTTVLDYMDWIVNVVSQYS